LDHGADPNLPDPRGITPLSTAALEPLSPVVELLISRGAKLDPKALYGAMDPGAEGGTEMVEYLIQLGIDLNAPCGKWGSPLHWATYLRNTEFIQLLLSKGADPTIRDSEGSTAADDARVYGANEIYELLSSASRANSA
jgi:uncharacterized protein